MKALLLVAHGSRLKQSNDEIFKLTDRLRNKTSGQFSIVHTAFLELAEPSIAEGIKNCIDEGALSIIVLPYFLNSGRHVIEDIPDNVKGAVKHSTGVEILIAPHIGASELMPELLIDSAKETLK